ncbi:MAG: hypothetical protein WBO10_01220 [Pyrinomonadaceae bacterium]
MKLRMRNNSIRLRMSQSEVSRLAADGKVEESIDFGAGPEAKLNYSIAKTIDGNEISARLSVGAVTVLVPAVLADEWVASDQVGLETAQPIRPGMDLNILIEKDFACLRPRDGEDDLDAFPHPDGKAKC